MNENLVRHHFHSHLRGGGPRPPQVLSADAAAVDVAHFHIVDVLGVGWHYLAVANSNEDAGPGVSVYRWSPLKTTAGPGGGGGGGGGGGTFLLHHTLRLTDTDPSAGAALPRGLRYLRAGAVDLLAVAVFARGDALDAESVVYRWNSAGSRQLPGGALALGYGFEPFQPLLTAGAVAFEHLAVPAAALPNALAADDGAVHLLAVANYAGGRLCPGGPGADCPPPACAPSSVWLFRPGRANPSQWARGGFPGAFEQLPAVPTCAAAGVTALTVPPPVAGGGGGGAGYTAVFAWAERRRDPPCGPAAAAAGAAKYDSTSGCGTGGGSGGGGAVSVWAVDPASLRVAFAESIVVPTAPGDEGAGPSGVALFTDGGEVYFVLLFVCVTVCLCDCVSVRACVVFVRVCVRA
jgi:hypothetical protein